MNIIPSTSKRIRTPYTVVGGEKTVKLRKYPQALSVLLLNRGSRFYRTDILEDLLSLGVSEILTIENPGHNYDVEELSARFPSIKFLMLHKEASLGEQINIGIEEASSSFVFVLWNDVKPAMKQFSQKLFTKIVDSDSLCVVPLVQNQKNETVPSISVPAFFKRKLKVVQLNPKSDGEVALYPFDFIGIYNKEKFLLSGGYDHSIKNSYWQKLDYGFRIYMWGEKISCNTALRLNYTGDIQPEDTTPDSSYKTFYLKNLSIRFNGDSGIIPTSRFIQYMLKSGSGLVNSIREFKEVRRWVRKNKFRFRQDARSITELWEIQDL